MKLNKNYFKISLGLLLIVFLLAGCSFQGSLLLNIKPNPVEFTYEKQSVDTTFKITTEGFGEITIDEISLLVLNNEKEKFTFDLNDFYDGEITESIYNEELKGNEFTLKIKITGSETTTKEVPIVFN